MSPRTPNLPPRVNNTISNSNGPPFIRSMRKRIKIGNIIANIFLGKEPGHSCNSPDFPIARVFYNINGERKEQKEQKEKHKGGKNESLL